MRRGWAGVFAALLTLTGALVGVATPAAAAPPAIVGPTVIAGGVTFSNSGDTQTWTQTTQRAVVTVQSLNVGSGATWEVRQPTPTSSLLVLVVGSPTYSSIGGQLRANGQLGLVDPDGLAVFPSGDLQAQSLVLSSLPASDVPGFAAGSQLTLRTPARTDTDRGIQQEGLITAGGGTVALLSTGAVTNAGTITAPGGRVVLGGTMSAGVQLGVTVPPVDPSLTPAPNPDEPMDQVLNQGLIQAVGGQVELHAQVSENIRSMGMIRSGDSRLIADEYFLAGDAVGSLEVTCRLTDDRLAARVTLDGTQRKPGETIDSAWGTLTFAHTFSRSRESTDYLFVNGLHDPRDSEVDPGFFGSTSCSVEQFRPGTPTVAGLAQVGQVIAAAPGAWTPAPSAFAFQWLRDGAPIRGETSQRHTVTAADAGRRLAVRITGTRVGYVSASRTSKAVAVPRVFTATPRPTIAGTPQVARVLTARAGAWRPAPQRLTYRWYRNGKAIAGAVRAQYRLVPQDRGARVSVVVTGIRSGYVPVARASLPVVVRR